MSLFIDKIAEEEYISQSEYSISPPYSSLILSRPSSLLRIIGGTVFFTTATVLFTKGRKSRGVIGGVAVGGSYFSANEVAYGALGHHSKGGIFKTNLAASMVSFVFAKGFANCFVPLSPLNLALHLFLLGLYGELAQAIMRSSYLRESIEQDKDFY